jgi:hypothetical protein
MKEFEVSFDRHSSSNRTQPLENNALAIRFALPVFSHFPMLTRHG